MQASVTDLSADITVLHLRGDLDAGTAAELHSALADLLNRPVPRIVVDLAGLRFSDSIGLSAFIVNRTLIADRGGWLSFTGVSPFLRRLLETVGVTRYFTVYGNIGEAIATQPAAVPA